jgi:hypothetical protein
VPLGEKSEQYLVRVRKAGALLREEVVTNPSWTYSVTQMSADGALGVIDVAVAQVSAAYGAGLARVLRVDL